MKTEEVIKILKSRYETVGKPSSGIMKVPHKGKYGFFNMEGEQILPFVYDWASSFIRIRLYGMHYIGAYVTIGTHKTIIDMSGQNIIAPMKADTMYYIIDGRLFVKDGNLYYLTDRKGRKMLDTGYDLVVNDRSRQPRSIFLLKRDGKYGVLHIGRGGISEDILPFVFSDAGFWHAPMLGTFIRAGFEEGRYGLYNLKGESVIPAEYTSFMFHTPFRRGFISAQGDHSYRLYDGTTFRCLLESRHPMVVQYAFFHDKGCHYTVHSSEQELLVNGNGDVMLAVNRERHVSLFHWLMNIHEPSFRFSSLGELVHYCHRIRREKRPMTNAVKNDIVVYGLYFLEELIHELACRYGFKYARFGLLDMLKDKEFALGTCNPKERVVLLNLNLLFTSKNKIRLTVLHELVHLENPEHDKAFYDRLNSLYGSDTRKIRINAGNVMNTVDAVTIIKRKVRELYTANVSLCQSCLTTAGEMKGVPDIEECLTDGIQIAAMEK